MLDIFDTICHDYTVTFKEFCLLIFVFAAFDAKELKLLLFMHANHIFSMLAGGEANFISSERMRRLGRILGFPERSLIAKAKELSL